jgi:hypothetical protein
MFPPFYLIFLYPFFIGSHQFSFFFALPSTFSLDMMLSPSILFSSIPYFWCGPSIVFTVLYPFGDGTRKDPLAKSNNSIN